MQLLDVEVLHFEISQIDRAFLFRKPKTASHAYRLVPGSYAVDVHQDHDFAYTV